jgi:hypothetical protein
MLRPLSLGFQFPRAACKAATKGVEMAKECSKDIYGCDPDGGAKKAADEGLKCMGDMAKPGKADKANGSEASHNGLEDLR